MLKTQVKASSITNLTDARYFAAWEVKWLGFNLDANAEDYIEPVKMKAMKEWVDGVEVVAEFGMQTASEIKQLATLLEIKTLQVGQFADVEMVKALSDFSIMKAIVIEMTTSESELLDQIQDFAPYCDHFLLDFDKNGLSWSELQSGSVLSVELVKTLCEKYSILIGINCPAVDLDDLLNELNPTGLNVKGGEEEQVGMKSFDELDEVFEVIEVLV
ncbi:MAG: phosphoribosylanthranilate isomerase [Paraglaciecola sp.]|jgi:phosphoribosylanthranilate isomerase